MLKENKSNKKSQLFIVGSLLLILIGFSLIFIKYYDRFSKEQVEEKLIEEYFNTSVISTSTNEDVVTENNVSDSKTKESYMAILEIPTINLRKGIFSKDSKNNNVEQNVTILDESNLPNEENGNVILVAHSGTGYKAFFNNLVELSNNDIAYLYYNNSRFTYKLANQYEVDKTGEVSIRRNTDTNTLTLITCKVDTNKQLVFIFEQYKEEF